MHAILTFHSDNGGGFIKSIQTNTPVNTVTVKNISPDNIEQAIAEFRAVLQAHIIAVPASQDQG